MTKHKKLSDNITEKQQLVKLRCVDRDNFETVLVRLVLKPRLK